MKSVSVSNKWRFLELAEVKNVGVSFYSVCLWYKFIILCSEDIAGIYKFVILCSKKTLQDCAQMLQC